MPTAEVPLVECVNSLLSRHFQRLVSNFARTIFVLSNNKRALLNPSALLGIRLPVFLLRLVAPFLAPLLAAVLRRRRR